MNIVVGLVAPVAFIAHGLYQVLFKRDITFGLWMTAGGIAVAMLAIKAFETT